MTERVRAFWKVLKQGDYRKDRRFEGFEELACWGEENSPEESADKFVTMLKKERPHLLPGDLFGFRRTLADTPSSPNRRRLPHNFVPDYPGVLGRGLADLLREIEEREPSGFFRALAKEIRALLEFCERTRLFAGETGAPELAAALERVPAQPPRSFYEALVFLQICLFALRCNRTNHVALGRFDQYLFPYYQRDLEKGVPEEDLFEFLELFFISLNVDTDLYFGIQKGDNGQSMVLGGVDPEGRDCYNRLSEQCLAASTELGLIDPKINLRVNKHTPLERYETGTLLTKKGLGFPQYLNDDVIIPGLMALGYEKKDACDYAVAACWEPITSGMGCDYVNLRNLNLPEFFIRELHENGLSYRSARDVIDGAKKAVRENTLAVMEECRAFRFASSPLTGLFIRNCVKTGREVKDGGAGYANFGLLVSGISTLADSVAAVIQLVFEEKTCGMKTLLAALDSDFQGYEVLRGQMLRAPKMGFDDDRADGVALELLGDLADTVNGAPNGCGGVFRVGTGSAQGYVTRARKCPATPDGRRAFAPYASSFTPSPLAKTPGPLSVIRSFTKFDLTRLINGGPLTLEIHDTVFRNEDGVKKTALLVKAFVERGGHELQLNSVNREVLLDARIHPEAHRDLIVRVWGWSGYFTELGPAYQDHVIARTEYRY